MPSDCMCHVAGVRPWHDTRLRGGGARGRKSSCSRCSRACPILRLPLVGRSSGSGSGSSNHDSVRIRRLASVGKKRPDSPRPHSTSQLRRPSFFDIDASLDEISIGSDGDSRVARSPYHCQVGGGDDLVGKDRHRPLFLPSIRRGAFASGFVVGTETRGRWRVVWVCCVEGPIPPCSLVPRMPVIQICLENQPAEQGFVLSACKHTFCRNCLQGYVTSKITDGKVSAMTPRGTFGWTKRVALSLISEGRWC